MPFADYLIDSNILLRIARRDDPDHAAVDAALTRLALDGATLYYTQRNIVSRVYGRTPHKGSYVKATPSIRSSKRAPAILAWFQAALGCGRWRPHSHQLPSHRRQPHEAIIKPIQRKHKSADTPDKLSEEQKRRFKKRTIVEQLNGRLKDEFGGRLIYFRGACNIMAHLMFGVVAITVDQLLRLDT